MFIHFPTHPDGSRRWLWLSSYLMMFGFWWPHCDGTGMMIEIRGILPKRAYDNRYVQGSEVAWLSFSQRNNSILCWWYSHDIPISCWLNPIVYHIYVIYLFILCYIYIISCYVICITYVYIYLYYMILNCTILYYFILYFILVYYSILYYIILFYIILCFIKL